MKLGEIARAIGAELRGDGEVEIRGVASLGSADGADLVFAQDTAGVGEAMRSRAAAVIARAQAGEPPASTGAVQTTKPVLIADNPRLAFARAAALLTETPPAPASIHPTAVIHPSAKLGKDVSVDAGAVIEPDAEIGERTHIGAYAVIGPGVKVGRKCRIRPHVTICPDTTLGDRVIVQAGAVLGSTGFGYVRDESSGRYEPFPQIGRLDIRDDVEIGANATIDRGALGATVIGRGTKLDNLVHVAHNVQIGENVVVAAQTGVAGSVVIESNVVIAGQVGIADHVRIEEGAILGAQCGVPSNKVIRGKGVVFWGTPARPIREYLKGLAAQARLAKQTRD